MFTNGGGTITLMIHHQSVVVFCRRVITPSVTVSIILTLILCVLFRQRFLFLLLLLLFLFLLRVFFSFSHRFHDEFWVFLEVVQVIP